MNALQIVCLIIISGCTVALLWSSIDCIYWTNKKIKLLREIQRRVTTEEDALDREMKKKILDARDAQGDWLEKKNEGKEDRP